MGAGGEEWNARNFDGTGDWMLEGYEKATLPMGRKREQPRHVRHQAERDAPLLRFVKQLVSGSIRQRGLKRGADFLKPRIRVRPGDSLVARVLGDVLAAEKLAQHVPLRTR